MTTITTQKNMDRATTGCAVSKEKTVIIKMTKKRIPKRKVETTAATASKQVKPETATLYPKWQIPTKRVYICSSFKGNLEKNIRKALLYCRFAFEQGWVPWAPHVLYARFLDDTNKIERAAGLRYGLEEMWRMKALWVFGDTVTEDMKIEIDLAKELEIPIKYFDSEMNGV